MDLYAGPLDRDRVNLNKSLSGKVKVEDGALTVIAGERIGVVGVDGLWLGMFTVVQENS